MVIFSRRENLNIFKLLRIGVFFIDFETIIEMNLEKECLLKKQFSDLRTNGLLRMVDLNLLERMVDSSIETGRYSSIVRGFYPNLLL